MASDELTREGLMQSALRSVGGRGGINEPITHLSALLRQLQIVGPAQTGAVQTNTAAVNQDTPELGRGHGLSAVGQAVSSTGSLGLSPLITGLLSLFGGGEGGSKPATFQKFVLPEPLNVNAVASEGMTAPPLSSGGVTAQGHVSGSAQITVQVQALDSRSFLDHSQDIAAAVRQAMLESSILNDVIREI